MQWNTEERESGNDLFSAWDGTQKKGNLEMACTETQFFVWDSSEFTRLERSRTFACFPDLHCVILSCIIAALFAIYVACGRDPAPSGSTTLGACSAARRLAPHPYESVGSL